jgi:hypothetical protein
MLLQGSKHSYLITSENPSYPLSSSYLHLTVINIPPFPMSPVTLTLNNYYILNDFEFICFITRYKHFLLNDYNPVFYHIVLKRYMNPSSFSACVREVGAKLVAEGFSDTVLKDPVDEFVSN